MSAKAEWRDFDWSKSRFPEREGDYHSWRRLVDAEGNVLAQIECFVRYPSVHYATAFHPTHARGGPIGDEKAAIAWCEAKTGNKVN